VKRIRGWKGRVEVPFTIPRDRRDANATPLG
jgi:hypothetical protein